MSHVDHAARRRKTSRSLTSREGLRVPSVAESVQYAGQLTIGGAYVHKRTHRCISTSNMLAALAGLDQTMEMR